METIHPVPRLTRRLMLSGSLAGLASMALPRRVHAETAADPDRQAEQLARARYLRERSPSSLVAWAEALRDGGDFDQARAALRELDAHRDLWGDLQPRIEALRTFVSFKEFRLEWAIPPTRFTQWWADLTTLSLAIPRVTADAVPKSTFAVEGVKSWEVKTDALGNRYVEAVRDPKRDVLIHCTAVLGVWNYRRQLGLFKPGELPAETRQYLVKATSTDGRRAVDPDGPRAQAVIKELALDALAAPERLARLLQWGKANIKWLPPGTDKTPGDSEAALAIGGGHCEHAASIMTALARAAGIPARLLRGNSAVQPGVPYPLQHSVAEFFLNGIGWVVPDPGQQLWTTVHNCVWKYHYKCPGDEFIGRLQFLEGIEYNPQPHVQISTQTLVREWV